MRRILYDNVPARPKEKKKITGMNRTSGFKRRHTENEVIESLSISVWLRVRAIHGERA